MQHSDEVVLTLTDDPVSRRRLPHPCASTVHILFRTTALIVYLVCGWLSASFIISFLLLLLLLSMDFWTVKNITGRLLVGLRWWNYVDEEGKSHWVFESRGTRSNSGNVSVTENRIFWLGLVASQLVWSLFFFAAVFTLKLRWAMVVVVAWTMNGANFYGYVRCRLGAKKNVSTAAREFLGRQVIGSMMGGEGTGSNEIPREK